MNDVYDVPLTLEEIAFLTNNLPSMARFPEQFDAFAMSQMPNNEQAGGMAFRLKMIAVRRHVKKTLPQDSSPFTTTPVEITVGELWMLDAVMGMMNTSTSLMGAGTPLMRFQEKVWDVLLDAYHGKIDPRYAPTSAKEPPVTDDQRKLLMDIDSLLSGKKEESSE